MMKKLLPFLAAVAVVALLLGPGRQLLPAGLRLQAGGSLVPGNDIPMDHGTITGIGLAPAPVTNPSASAARLGLAARPLENSAQGYVLTTTLTGADGKAIPDATVRFYALVDLFGEREMIIGSSVTDGRGLATLNYLPALTGTQQIVSRFAGQGKVTAGEGRMRFEATVAAPRPVEERSLFHSFADRVPYAAALIVVAVWALIGFALIATVRGVIGAAHPSRGKEELA